MKVAALDLGSNTFLLLIAEVVDGRMQAVIEDQVTLTRLGEGVHKSRSFSESALERAEDCFKKYSELIKKHNVEKVVAVSTSAARDVSNSAAFLELGQKWGIPIKIISGDLEANLTFKGAIFDQPSFDQMAVIDVGGGSTEIISGGSAVNTKGYSLDVGSVRLTELFVKEQLVSQNVIEQMEKYIASEIEKNRSSLPEGPFDKVIAVAGTPTTLALVELVKEFDEELIHGYEMSLDKLISLRDRLAGMNLEDRKQLPGMEPKRADVIVAGTTILIESLKLVQGESLIVSTKGVRFGLALNWSQLV